MNGTYIIYVVQNHVVPLKSRFFYLYGSRVIAQATGLQTRSDLDTNTCNAGSIESQYHIFNLWGLGLQVGL